MWSLKRKDGLAKLNYCDHNDSTLLAKGRSATTQRNFNRNPGHFRNPHVFILFPHNDKFGTHSSEKKGRTQTYWDPAVCLVLPYTPYSILTLPRRSSLSCCWLKIPDWKTGNCLATSFLTTIVIQHCQSYLQRVLDWIPSLLNHLTSTDISKHGMMTTSSRWLQ